MTAKLTPAQWEASKKLGLKLWLERYGDHWFQDVKGQIFSEEWLAGNIDALAQETPQ